MRLFYEPKIKTQIKYDIYNFAPKFLKKIFKMKSQNNRKNIQ